MYKAPKSVSSHPAVESCTSGEAESADQKHYVILREGWWFGPRYQTSSLFFDHVREPKQATGRVWEHYAVYIERRPEGA